MSRRETIFDDVGLSRHVLDAMLADRVIAQVQYDWNAQFNHDTACSSLGFAVIADRISIAKAFPERHFGCARCGVMFMLPGAAFRLPEGPDAFCGCCWDLTLREPNRMSEVIAHWHAEGYAVPAWLCEHATATAH